jgi:hypothetical protein
MNQIRKRLTYANVMSSIAVFLVLGGGAAFAALGKNTVGTRQLKPNSVNRGILARNSVYPGKINLEAVKAGRIAKNAIASDRLRNNIVSTDKLQDLAVTSGKLADNAVNQPKVATDAIGAAQVKGLTTRTNSVTVNPGTSNATNVSCLGGEQIVSAGTHWSATENNLETNYVQIVGNTALARGNNDTASNRTFFVDAYCLQE